jgi:GTP cyclohydrolase II
MKASLSTPIHLSTKQGTFLASHIVVQDTHGSPVREGVVLRSPAPIIDSQPVIVRVQSSCLFSESFWATGCDCSLQLQKALSLIAVHGGLVLYFYEEGRGAGLATKFAAIHLQQLHALDTKQAYECLNLKPDDRSYSAAAAALKAVLGSSHSIQLLTNNRDKEEGLRREGINVATRLPLICGWESPEVRQYLLDKKTALGHDIPNDYDEESK